MEGDNLATRSATAVAATRPTYGLPFVITAASAGTIIEWYDFYLYATLTPFLAPIFFPSDNPTASALSAFAAYAAGFLVRPFGAAFFLALAIILFFRLNMSAQDFASQGWRYPFWISAVLVVFALYIRIKLQETPLFARLKQAKQSVTGAGNWASEAFSGRKVGTILLVLLGLTAGQGVVWYQGQFQANFFMTTYLKLTFQQSYTIMLWAVALGTPFFLVFGWLSDKIGRKVIILAGCLIAAVTYLPIYHAMTDAANVKRDATGLITGADPNTPLLVALVWIQVI